VHPHSHKAQQPGRTTHTTHSDSWHAACAPSLPQRMDIPTPHRTAGHTTPAPLTHAHLTPGLARMPAPSPRAASAHVGTPPRRLLSCVACCRHPSIPGGLADTAACKSPAVTPPTHHCTLPDQSRHASGGAVTRLTLPAQALPVTQGFTRPGPTRWGSPGRPQHLGSRSQPLRPGPAAAARRAARLLWRPAARLPRQSGPPGRWLAPQHLRARRGGGSGCDVV